MDKLKIIIAGPGAGKTFNLKNEVLACLPNLDRNRFCAVITYTNAATSELRQRISSEIPIPPNVFIGTIHSFLIRFVIEPFGHLMGLVPIDKNYIESVNLNYQPSNIFAEKSAKQKKVKDLAKKGFLVYDIIIEYSKNILEQSATIPNIMGNRLQYIFIDEYQDSKIFIHQIFQIVLSMNISSINIIGDPLQSVFKFTYSNSLIKDESKSLPKSFTETPMMLFKSMFRSGIDEILLINYRSSVNIVNLLNKFYSKSDQEQRAINGDNGIPIYFIEKTDYSEIYRIYKLLKNEHNIDDLHDYNIRKSKKSFFRELFLTKDWIDNKNSKKTKLKNVFKVLCSESVRLEKGNCKVNSIFQEISRCMLGVTGVKKQNIINSTHDELEYRKFCFEMARCLKTMDFNDYENCIGFIRQKFQMKFNNLGDQADEKKSIFELSNKTSISLSHNPESCYSSIHSAKGLEATSVLAIAYSNNELEKWLNFKEANNNLDDDYRLGYVAFSRARDMLCISCLGEISPEIKNKMVSLNIVFCSN